MKNFETLSVGQRIKDNDPRVTITRELTIAEVAEDRVVAKDNHGRKFRLLRRRIYTDGKPRKNGFDLVRETKS